MKSIRKKIKFLSLFMAITMLFFSCSQYEDINGNEEKSNLYARTGKNYTGEEIFRGLFFFQNRYF